MSEIKIDIDTREIVVQVGEDTDLAARAAQQASILLAQLIELLGDTPVTGSFSAALLDLQLRGVVGAGTLAEREAYTFRDGGVTPAVSSGNIWLRVDGGQVRMEVWKAIGDTGIDGTTVALAGWKGYKTQSEMDNMSIGKTGTLPKERVEALIDALTRIDDLAKIRISNFRAKALTGGSTPAVELDADLQGVDPTSLSVAWGGYQLAIPALPWMPKDQAAVKDFFVSGNSIDDATDVPMWHTILAARRGVTSRFTARYTSDQHQLFRAGLTPLMLTIAGNSLPTGGTSKAITAINGNTPINSNADYAFLSTGDAGLTTGVTMQGVIVDGTNSRHGTAAAPNAGSAAYTFTQDVGLPAINLEGPVLFVPDIAKFPAISDNFCGVGNNIFYSGVPNLYGDHTNPSAYEIIDKFAAAAEGNRFLIRDVLPVADWPIDGTPVVIDGIDYTTQLFSAMEAFNARNEERHPGSRARSLPRSGHPNGLTLLQFLQTRGDGSANDNADIAAGVTPRSLRFDSLHPNLAGQTAMADFFEEAMEAQALAPSVTLDTFFTLLASGTLPRTGASTSASAVAQVAVDARTNILSQEVYDMLMAGTTFEDQSVTITEDMLDGTAPVLAADPARRIVRMYAPAACTFGFDDDASDVAFKLDAETSTSFVGAECPRNAVFLIEGLALDARLSIKVG